MNGARKFLAIVISSAMVFSMLAGVTMSASAAAKWRSALYPENWTPGYTNSSGQFLHDFSYAGYMKGEQEPPTTMPGLTANVLDYGADNTGANDSTSAIQSAINAVQNAGGGTVYLPAGTYKVKPSGEGAAALRITGSNIIFKGDGIGKTFIRCFAENMRSSQIITVSPNGGTWDTADDGNYYYLSKDIGNAPTTTISLNSVGNLKAGDWVIIRSNRTAAWINEHSMSGFWSADVNPTTMGTTFYRQIKSVNANAKTIEIDIPTRYYMKTRDNARVYKVMPKQSNVGLMDFSIGNKMNPATSGWGEEDYKTSGTGAYNVHSAFLLKFSHNVNCFAKNIASYQAGNSSTIHMSSNGLDINRTRNLTVDSCDFSHPQYEGGGGNGYGMNVCGQETLIKNCSSTSARHSFSFKYAYANGNVIYHYTSTDPKYGSDFHMYLSMANLVDNEELNGDFVESNVRPYGGTAGNRHGYTSTQTVFWNTKGNYYKSGSSYIIDSRQFGYGYIIGTRGNATAVKTTPTTMSSQYGTVNTAPEDYKEGIGTSADLEPQSLYYDQLQRRLGPTEPKDPIDVPATFNSTEYTSKSSEITNNGTYVGNLGNGTYLDYSINVPAAGDYMLSLNAATGNANSNRVISVYSGSTLLNNIPIVNGDDWFAYKEMKNSIHLNAGVQTIRLTSSGSVNIENITIANVPATYQIPCTISAGDYMSSEGSVYIDSGAVRDIAHEEKAFYKVNVPETGEYKVTVETSAAAATRLHIDTNLTGSYAWVNTINIPATADLNTFVPTELNVNLTAGVQTLKFNAQEDLNLKSIRIEKVEAAPAEPGYYVFKAGSDVVYSSVAGMAAPMGTKCELVDGKAHLPVRPLAMATNSTINYDVSANKITMLNSAGIEFEMQPNSTNCIMKLNGSTQTAQINAPKIIGGAAYLPMREISMMTLTDIGYVDTSDAYYVVVSSGAMTDAQKSAAVANAQSFIG